MPRALKKVRGSRGRGDKEGRAAHAQKGERDMRPGEMKRAVPHVLKKVRGTRRQGDEEGHATHAQKGERDTVPGRRSGPCHARSKR